VRVAYPRARRGAVALAASLVLLAGCSVGGGEPASVTTPYARLTPSPVPSSERPSAPSTGKAPRNDLKTGRATHSLKAGSVSVKVQYSLRNSVQNWSLGIVQSMTVSLTARRSKGVQAGRVTKQKIYLFRVSALTQVSDAAGHLGSPNTIVDRADVTPGFLVTSPTYYTQVFTLPVFPAKATRLTIDFRYEILLLQSTSAPRDFAKRTATDTLIISRP
jgi:hypothetical protein